MNAESLKRWLVSCAYFDAQLSWRAVMVVASISGIAVGLATSSSSVSSDEVAQGHEIRVSRMWNKVLAAQNDA
jgi:hypothetical protein